MQIHEDLAQGSRQESSSVSSPTPAKSEDLDCQEISNRRNSAGLRSSVQRVVLLGRGVCGKELRKDDQTGNAGECLASHAPSRQREIDNVAKFHITGLSVGESHLISRRRSGLSQQEMADFCGITRNFYGEVERDQIECSNLGRSSVESLKLNEKMLLARRRAELTQGEVAAEIGVTRYWLNQMEIGAAPVSEDLTKFWEVKYGGEQ